MRLLSYSLLLLGLSIVNLAQAKDGTITITGTITNNTCTINGATGAADKNVPLDTVSVSGLSTAGATAGMMSFQLALSNCTGSTAKALFEMGANVDSKTGNLINSTAAPTGATNVQVRLLNDQLKPINLVDNTNSQTVDTSSKEGVLTYYAQYYATGKVTGGKVTTSVNYTMSYN